MTDARTETVPWDAADHLDSPSAELEYLSAAFEDGVPDVIAAAIGDVARARGATRIARQSGMSRETLYKAFSNDGNPTLSTLLSVLKAMDIQLVPSPLVTVE